MELPIIEQGTVVGSCHWEQEGLRVRFRCRIPGRRSVCKLWLERNSVRTLLGTPAPGENDLTLDRTFSERELERSGSFPPERVICISHGAKPDRRGQGFCCGDDFLRHIFCQGGWSWQPWEKGTELCHLWPDRSPFPAPALFCFCRVSRGRMGRIVTIRLDEKGFPVLWQQL